MILLVKGNIFPNNEALEELNIKYINYEDQTLIELPHNMKIVKNADNKHIKDKKFTPYYFKELLKKYHDSDDNSLDHFLVVNHKLVASGEIKADKKNKDVYVCNDTLRVYTELFTTYDLILAGECGGEDLANFYECLLRNSVTIDKKKKSR